MRRVIILFMAAGAIACGSDSPTSPINSVPGNPSGVYALTTINSQALPFTLGQNDTASAQLTGGAITLGTDGSFLDVLNVVVTVPSGTSLEADTLAGTYSVSGNSVVFVPNDNSGSYVAALTDTSLVEANPSYTIVYRKQ
ncbi:MAG TPA: hypothetical protein VHB25_21690 [Gemmatimonadaceae bacterium]|nr:hypothetical protein [Gemmatimonadaceae bacterium]